VIAPPRITYVPPVQPVHVEESTNWETLVVVASVLFLINLGFMAFVVWNIYRD
jgi:hypothetical protein